MPKRVNRTPVWLAAAYAAGGFSGYAAKPKEVVQPTPTQVANLFVKYLNEDGEPKQQMRAALVRMKDMAAARAAAQTGGAP